MPIFENECVNPACERFQADFEWYAHTADKPDPICECGQQTVRLISRFSAIWTGSLSRFDDNSVEQKNDKDGGHVAYRIRSSRLGIDKNTGQPIPEPVLVRNRQEQREFIRAEGLEDPTDLNPHMSGTDSGMAASHEQRGARGQWV